MARQLFVNLPVDDLPRSKEFFTELGFTFNPQFSDENAACMVVNDESYVMLLATQFFETFTDKEIANSTETTEVLIALSADSREEIDELVETAVAGGATESREPQEHESMYGRSFEDLDGHIWELTWMDPSGM